ncbi:2-oxoglutarate-dependent dioxygenase DAO-like [Rutidosis leptorrhynchoides]|uniref:2-oxoglutarate-dependent dioxygenase DAO-like n=1 Tax=Rutidosis leptorrhynchoides TaxID=125765 RepID=UPI003A9A0597
MARDKVPVIDMLKADGLAEEIVNACKEWGYFRVINHGVPIELLAQMKAVNAELFDRSTEIKKGTLGGVYGKGYMERNPVTPFLESLSIDDISTFTHDFCDRLHTNPQQREIIQKYIKAMRDLAGVLGRKLMEGNGLKGDLFDGWCCQMRMNKYNYSPESVGSCGVFLHSDPSFMTILQDDEDVNGLQMVDKYTGEFIPVDPVPGTLAINMGDIAKAWSNGTFCNVQHRVWCFEPKTRYSIVLFVLGPDKTKVEAPPEFVDSEHPRLYVPIDIKEYRQVRSASKLSNGDALELFRNTKT